MSRLFAVVGAFVAFAGCAPEEYSPIALTDFYLAPASCEFPKDTTLSSLRGSLEVYASAPTLPRVRLGYKVVASLGGPGDDLQAGGTVLQPKDMDRALLDTMVVKLTTTPALKLPDYTIPMYGTFTDGMARHAYFDVLSPEAGAIIQGVDRAYELAINIEIRGRMSRSGAAISTGSVAFPVGVTPYLEPCTKLGVGVGCAPPGFDGYPICCDGLQSDPLIGCN